MTSRTAARLGAAFAALSLAAVPTVAQTARPLAPDPFVTAVHGGPAAGHSGYGRWVSGSTYKASFGDGFAFYPLLGAGYPDNLPLRWTTVAVTAGGEVVATGAPEPALRVFRHRVEYDHGAFVEAYDVRPAGIEQTFVLDRAPAIPGDLVVTGRIDSALTAATAVAAHQALVFRGPGGEAIVRYGAATAVDAAGERAAMTTAWDGQHVHLRLGADFLARAVFPVTLDPLIARVQLTAATAPVRDLDLVRAPAGNGSKLMTVYSRVFAGNDVDSYACVSDAAFGNPVTVFADVSASWSTKGGRCAWSGDAQRWAAVFERELSSPTTSVVLTYFHQRDDTVLNSGVSGTLAVPAGTTARNPDVGGRYAGGGENVLVVYQTDPTTTQQNTANTEVWCVLVHAPTATAASVPDTLDWFAAGTTYDREHPTVVKMSDGDSGFWIVAWHELFRPAVPDDWDVNTNRITFSGQKMAQRYRLGQGAHPWHKRYPRLAGGDGRFMVAMTLGATSSAPTADAIEVQRFDWPDSAWDPVLHAPRTVASDSQTPDHAFPAIAFDAVTRSHWAVTYERGPGAAGDLFVARIGPAGGVVESEPLFQSPVYAGGPAAVTFAPENGGSFPAVYATDEVGEPLFGTALVYPAGAQNTLYGTSCGGQIGATPPYAGSEFFTVSLLGASPSQLAALGVSGAAAAVSLGPALPGCFRNVELPLISVPAVTGPSGGAAVTIAIPESLPPGFTLYFQWAYLDPGSSGGVSTTTGLRSVFE